MNRPCEQGVGFWHNRGLQAKLKRLFASCYDFSGLGFSENLHRRLSRETRGAYPLNSLSAWRDNRLDIRISLTTSSKPIRMRLTR